MHRAIHNGDDFYTVLKVPASATDADIRRAYRHAALSAHPDKGGTKEGFHLIAVAFQVLSCTASRAAYDKLLGQGDGIPSSGTSAAASRGTKRQAPQAGIGTQRRRKGRRRDPSRSQLIAALEQLQGVIRSAEPPLRRGMIESMPPVLRSALVAAMTKQAQEHRRLSAQTAGVRRHPSKSSLLRGVAAMRTIRYPQRTRYVANAQFSALRLYGREQSGLETAIEQQSVLVRLRHAMTGESSRDAGFWLDGPRAYEVCKAVLDESGTSEELLNLRVWVQMRATGWLGPRSQVASGAMGLREAFEVHAGLHRARATSWAAFREEWVRLMCVRRGGSVSRRSAEAAADAARSAFLKQQLANATKSVEVALQAHGSFR